MSNIQPSAVLILYDIFRPPPLSTLFPYTTLFRSIHNDEGGTHMTGFRTALTRAVNQYAKANNLLKDKDPAISGDDVREDRKSTRLNSSHSSISYAVFCLKKKTLPF